MLLNRQLKQLTSAASGHLLGLRLQVQPQLAPPLRLRVQEAHRSEHSFSVRVFPVAPHIQASLYHVFFWNMLQPSNMFLKNHTLHVFP